MAGHRPSKPADASRMRVRFSSPAPISVTWNLVLCEREHTPGHAGVAQLVEYLLPKQNVVGSNPITRSKEYMRPRKQDLGNFSLRRTASLEFVSSHGHGVHVVVFPCDLTGAYGGWRELPLGSKLRTRETTFTVDSMRRVQLRFVVRSRRD